MAVHDHARQRTGFHLPTWNRTSADGGSGTATAAADATFAARSLAACANRDRLHLPVGLPRQDLRLALRHPIRQGLDRWWLARKGFLSGVSAGPLQSFFHDIAGKGWTDWLFMLGLLGIGVALVSGVALRLTAVAGTALMAMMWAAEWPPAQHLSSGGPSMSSNPLVDYHVIYALAMILFALTAAGTTWGLGRLWARIPFVHRNPWLR